MFRRFFAISAIVFVLVLARTVVAADKSHHLTVEEQKQVLLWAPPPKYPVGGRSAGIRGSGVFRLHVREASGEVIKVEVRQSTGHTRLDEAAVKALRSWRFRGGTGIETANVPVTFTL